MGIKEEIYEEFFDKLKSNNVPINILTGLANGLNDNNLSKEFLVDLIEKRAPENDNEN